MYRISSTMQKTALDQRHVNELSLTDRPMDEVFSDSQRVLVPLINSSIMEIVESLQNGETNTGTEYRVDVNKGVAYRYVMKKASNQTGLNEQFHSDTGIKQTVKELDPRPMRLGKVIMKELGKEKADEWSVQQNSIADGDFMIIVSRNPIDVARMSDHDGIYSCHNPNREYFAHAMEEAIEGGAIAYVVDTKEYREFANQAVADGKVEDIRNAVNLPEIFRDVDRGIGGITPISRLRINRYSDSYENDPDVLLPTTTMYGKDVAGFKKSLTDWLHKEQDKSINISEIDLNDYQRNGGAYADDSDNAILENYFGDDMGIREMPHKAGTVRAEIFKEELAGMQERVNNDLPDYIQVYGDVDVSDGEVRIYGGVDIHFYFRGNWTGKTGNINYKDIVDIISGVDLGRGEFERGEVSFENGIVHIELNGYIDNDVMFGTPDDWEDKAMEIVRWANDSYLNAYEGIGLNIITNGLLDSEFFTTRKDHFPDKDELEFKGMPSRAYEMTVDEDSIDFSLEFSLPISKTMSNSILSNTISQTVEKYAGSIVQDVISQEKNQESLSFYSPLSHNLGDIDYSNVKINGVSAAINRSYDSDNFSCSIDIPIGYIWRFGTQFFQVLLGQAKPKLMEKIIEEIMIANDECVRVTKDHYEALEKNRDPSSGLQKDRSVINQEASVEDWYTNCIIAEHFNV